MKPDDNPPKPRRSRAAELLARLRESTDLSAEVLAAELGTSIESLDALIDGRESLSLEQQARIAAIAIARVPALARAAHRLAAQVDAARRYHLGETERHSHDGRPRNIW